LSPKVRAFVVLVDVNGAHPNLMPDLTASLDVTLSRVPNVLVVPRDAVSYDGERPFVRVKRGSSYHDQVVTLGPTSSLHAVLASGVEEGTVIARNVATAANNSTAVQTGSRADTSSENKPQAKVETGR
jgi:multidrug efflux pump subunit AcrA (membrane-fusion protein)